MAPKNSWGQVPFDFQRLNVERLKGDLYAFRGPKERPTKLAPGDQLGAGILLATSRGTIAVLNIPGPSYLYLGEDTRVYLRGVSSSGLWVLSLLSGKIIVKPKNGLEERPANTIVTIRNAREGFLGKDFMIEFTRERSLVTTRTSGISQIELPVLEIKEGTNKLAQVHPDADVESDIESDIEDDFDIESDIEEAPTGNALTAQKPFSREELRPLSSGQFAALVRPSQELVDIDSAELAAIRIEHDVTSRLEQRLTARYSKFPSAKEEELQDIDTNFYDLLYDWKYRVQAGNNGYIFNGWAEYGSEDRLYSGKFEIFKNDDIKRPVVTLNELYYSRSGENFDLSIGKKIIKNGFGIIFSPIDDITPKDLYDPLDKRDLGNWSVQGDFYIERFTLTAALIPFFRPNRQYHIPVEDFNGDLNMPEHEVPNSSFSNFLLRGKTTIEGWDLLLGVFNGHSIYNAKRGTYSRRALPFPPPSPFPSRDEILEKYSTRSSVDYYPQITSIFGGFSTLGLGGVVYSDFKYQSPHKEEEDSSYYSVLIGHNRKINWLSQLFGLNDVNWYIEYSRTIYKNHRELTRAEEEAIEDRILDSLLFESYEDSLFGADSLQTRFFNNSLVTKIILNVNDDLNLGVAFNIDFDPRENSLTKFDAFTLFYQLSLDYKLYKDLIFKTTYEVRKELKEFATEDSSTSFCQTLGESARCDLSRLTVKFELPF